MTYVDRDYDFIAHPLYAPPNFRDVDDGDRVNSHRLRVGLLLGAHQPRLGSIDLEVARAVDGSVRVTG